MNKEYLLNTFYNNNNIQMHIDVINDILDECENRNMNILVFGLGNDSNLWYNATKNITFVEDDISYINRNNDKSTIYYTYPNITVSKSYMMPIHDIHSYKIPEELLKLAPFDMIIIDGPRGYKKDHPGRLLPIYWSTYYLSKSGTIIYIDDSKRELELECIQRFLSKNKTKHFPQREGCDKFII
jgi:hypothetical protein